MAMKLGAEGKKLIQSFEGCRLDAYKAVSTEKYWTIGWGHYGPDIRQGQTITKDKANELFDEDIQSYVNAVNNLGITLNQNQFDALVSFCYNCGIGSLKQLVKDRSLTQISNSILLYNKSGGKVLADLIRRRATEQKLFNTPVKNLTNKSTSTKSTVKDIHTVIKGDTVSKIAKNHGVTIEHIKKLNKLDADCKIKIDQKLRVK